MATDSGIPVRAVYRSDDVAPGLESRLGDPGHPPYTRGPYQSMYRERPWTMRQYAGYGSAEDTNARYRFLLDQGQTALSVAFDLPTQLGYDSSDAEATAEVGRVGVAIDTVDDLSALFDDLPLDELSINFTINSTAPIIFAFYLVAAERQGVEWRNLSGTTQNDILKEFVARKTYIYPPSPSLRLVTDLVEFATEHVPRFNPISVTGYHAREAGCDAIQELALTMASATAYSDAFVARGIPFDRFAPRLSFHFATTLDLFEEVAKLRAARRMWHRIATERFGCATPESARLRFFSGCSGSTLTAQQPLNNIARSTIQCLGAVLGGAQSIHVMGYDEAMEIPSEEAVTVALRTQQIVAYESGVTNTVDPLAGSYYVESLTDEVERRALELMSEIEDMGGLVAAIDAGVPQRWIADRAFEYERSIADGSRVKVGVNRFATSERPQSPRLFEVDRTAGERQIERLAQRMTGRDAHAAERAKDALRSVCASDTNVMPTLIEAARAGVSLGEMSRICRLEFGEYVEPVTW